MAIQQGTCDGPNDLPQGNAPHSQASVHVSDFESVNTRWDIIRLFMEGNDCVQVETSTGISAGLFHVMQGGCKINILCLISSWLSEGYRKGLIERGGGWCEGGAGAQEIKAWKSRITDKTDFFTRPQGVEEERPSWFLPRTQTWVIVSTVANGKR